MERYAGQHQKEPGHQTRDTASPVDRVRSPGVPLRKTGRPLSGTFRSIEGRTVLTFRDANSVRWVRMPDGALKEQSAATARDSILAIALGG
jgi:hypothetical protein